MMPKVIQGIAAVGAALMMQTASAQEPEPPAPACLMDAATQLYRVPYEGMTKPDGKLRGICFLEGDEKRIPPGKIKEVTDAYDALAQRVALRQADQTGELGPHQELWYVMRYVGNYGFSWDVNGVTLNGLMQMKKPVVDLSLQPPGPAL